MRDDSDDQAPPPAPAPAPAAEAAPDAPPAGWEAFQEGCYDAGARLIEAFQAMLDALAATPVPPRFAEGDNLLREAIAENLRGLELRNRAIAALDNAAWHEQKVVLEKASSMIDRAYLAFPEDNRPQPRP